MPKRAVVDPRNYTNQHEKALLVSFDVFGKGRIKRLGGHCALMRIGTPISPLYAEAATPSLRFICGAVRQNLLLRQKLFSLAKLGPGTVGVSHERHNFPVVSTGFLLVSGEFGGERGAVESIESLR